MRLAPAVVVPLLAALTLSGSSAALAAGTSAVPAAPSVSSAEYPADVWSPPRPGVLEFGANGVADVVAFQYDFTGDYRTLTVPAVGGSARVPYTPTSPGPHAVFVHSVTAAGTVSDVRQYSFEVSGHGRADATWRFDEPVGATSAVDEVGARVAALTGGAHVAPGTGRTWEEDPGDGALAVRAGGGGARTSGPVVDTSAAFTVTAWVRLPELTATSGPAADRTVVSEDGRVRSGFWLGYDADAVADADPTTRNGTFVFRMRTADTYGAQVVQAQADRQQVTDELQVAGMNYGGYVSVAARYDGVGTLDIFVGGTKAGPSAHLPRDWRATGDLRLGSGRSDGHRASLGGDLDHVSVWPSALFDSEVAGASLEP